MIIACHVCGARANAPIFVSPSDCALTSLCEARAGRSRVWACPRCAHLYSEPLPDVQDFYESDYRISLDHEDEDQIYEVRGDDVVYRTEHQARVFLDKLALPQGARVLDYGCAKASTLRKVLAHRPDLKVHLFDVSEMYVPYWERLVPPDRTAVHKMPVAWSKSFDAVTSFFALEHIPLLRDALAKVVALLRDGGTFYGVVPDVFTNIADFVVIDHVNHFTVPSLHTLLCEAGLGEIDIDPQCHRGALVFQARKGAECGAAPEIKPVLERSLRVARYWSGIDARLRDAEQANRMGAAIYGSGFYGSYIFTALSNPGRVVCFLDRSPFQQGKTMFGKPVIAPEHLPPNVDVLYVGLNPKIARASLEDADWLRGRDISIVFLDEAEQ